MTPLAPIQPRYLRDQAFLRLRDAIVEGHLAPGQAVVIDDLATTFGLSTMPVREAVKRLVSDGLIEELPRRAHRVMPLTRESALAILGVTETLMVRAYELGAARLGAEEIARMREALAAASERSAAADVPGTLAAIHAMHGVVYEATGNPEFERLLAMLVPRFNRVLTLWYTESIADVAGTYRRDLVEALERGDADAAVEIMREAWRTFRRVIEARAD